VSTAALSLVHKGLGNARVAVARKLGIRLWIILRDEIDYPVCRRGQMQAASLTMSATSPVGCSDYQPLLHRECNNTEMVSVPLSPHDNALRLIHRIQALTIIWMTVEVAVSLTAARIAHSPSLLAFGGDSAIELLSAAVVLWEFSGRVEKHRETRIAGVLLFVLAGYVTVVSLVSLLGYSEPRPSYLGLAILIAAATIMPWLANEKRKLSAATGSAALRADAAQSGVCAYLSLIALVGLGVNAIWHVSWADPIAALAVTPLIVWEGKEAIRGKARDCC